LPKRDVMTRLSKGFSYWGPNILPFLVRGRHSFSWSFFTHKKLGSFLVFKSQFYDMAGTVLYISVMRQLIGRRLLYMHGCKWHLVTYRKDIMICREYCRDTVPFNFTNKPSDCAHINIKVNSCQRHVRNAASSN
jgi:hypothetical protein